MGKEGKQPASEPPIQAEAGVEDTDEVSIITKAKVDGAADGDPVAKATEHKAPINKGVIEAKDKEESAADGKHVAKAAGHNAPIDKIIIRSEGKQEGAAVDELIVKAAEHEAPIDKGIIKGEGEHAPPANSISSSKAEGPRDIANEVKPALLVAGIAGIDAQEPPAIDHVGEESESKPALLVAGIAGIVAKEPPAIDHVGEEKLADRDVEPAEAKVGNKN
jgi:hypothetical protein